LQTCPGFLKKILLEYPGNLLEICSVKSVDTLKQVADSACILGYREQAADENSALAQAYEY